MVYNFVSGTLRALYLADNDFETLPADIGKLINLQIVSMISYTQYWLLYVSCCCVRMIPSLIQRIFI